MTYARKSLISLQDTSYYHVIARCVRRAWLWGFDDYAGKDYSHRKAWVLERLEYLSTVFAIDICAYAVMSNHYHLVVHVDQKRRQQWTTEEIIERWTRLFSKPPLVERWQAQRLNIDPGAWQQAMQPCGNVFGRAIGKLDHLRLHARALGQSWVRGLHQAHWMYR